MNTEAITNLPAYQKAIILILIITAIAGGFIYIKYIPLNNQIKEKERVISQLNEEIKISKTKADRLEDLKRENRELQNLLAEQQEQLPPEEEVVSLLKQISDLGIKTGLDFKLWRPGERKPSQTGLYTEIPVNVEVSGGYHSLALFFDKISKLPRIINISNLNMSNAKSDKERFFIQSTFVSTAFAASSGDSPVTDEKKAQKKKAKNEN